MTDTSPEPIPTSDGSLRGDLSLFAATLKLADVPLSSLIPPVALGVVAIVLRLLTFALFIPLVRGLLTGDFSRLDRFVPLSRLFPGSGDEMMPIFLGLAILTFALIRGACAYGSRLALARRTEHASARLSRRVLRSYLGFGQQYYDLSQLGIDSRRVQKIPARVTRLINVLDRTSRSLLALALYAAAMAWISIPLTVLATVALVLYYLAFGRTAARLEGLADAVDEADDQLGTATHDLLLNLPLVRLATREDAESDAHGQNVDSRAAAQMVEYRSAEISDPIRETLDLVVMLALVAAASWLLQGLSPDTAALYVVFFLIFRRGMGDFAQILKLPTERAKLRNQLHGLFEAFDPAGKFILPDGDLEFRGLEEGIVARNLDFSYEGRDVGLHDLSLVIPAGGRTFVVGATGSGKSTLLRLLLRLYDCPPDSLLLDGVDIRRFRIASLRRNLFFTASDPNFFDGTLRHNVCYGAGDVDEARLREAARRADMLEEIEAMPEGFDTPVGDRGNRLSSGQRQRLALVRLFLSPAPIVLLDEATSALDAATEALVSAEMSQHAEGRTLVVIAHRLSGIGEDDNVVVFRDGRCVEEGRRDTLLRQGGEFARLWRIQRLPEPGSTSTAPDVADPRLHR